LVDELGKSASRTAIVVDLALDASHVEALYRGVARTVVARSRDGRWIRFPADALRRHVTWRGVHGTYALHVDDGRLTSMERLSS